MNTKGQYFVAQEAFRNVRRGGRIILLSSRTAQGRGFGAHAIYAASKEAVEAMVRCLSVDCGEKQITIDAVAPRPTMTDQMKNYPRYLPDGDNITEAEVKEIISSWHPLQRPGEPEVSDEWWLSLLAQTETGSTAKLSQLMGESCLDGIKRIEKAFLISG